MFFVISLKLLKIIFYGDRVSHGCGVEDIG